MVTTIDANYIEQVLFPPALEDWVGEDHPARFIREFVWQLDLEALNIRMPELQTGRPPFSVWLLLRLWLYGYWRRIRSSRKLEEACKENVGFMWLCGAKVPDHNTLWRFFKANKKALRKLFKKTVKIAVQLDLVDFVLQALDGTKIQGACSGYGSHSKKDLEKRLERLDGVIEELEKKIEEENRGQRVKSASLPENLQKAEVLREKIRAALDEVESGETRHCHPQEPEARRMPCDGKNRFGYNAQAVVDSANHIIVAEEVTQAQEDSGQLAEMGELAVETSGEKPERLVADGGYADSEQLKEAEEKGLDVITPLPSSCKNPSGNKYHSSNFRYDKEKDVFVCPEGRELPFRRERVKNKRTGKKVREYRSAAVCLGCPMRGECTRDRHGRTVELQPGYEALERLRGRLEEPENQKSLKKRGQTVELVFAWIKGEDGFRRWTAKGLDNVRAQWSIICAVRNLKQIYKKWRESRKKETPVRMVPELA